MTKQQFRDEINTLINRMTSEERQKESGEICSRIIQSEQWQKADTIFLFLAFKNEINIDKLISQAVSEGKKAAVPFCKSRGEMDFYPVNSLDPSLYELNRWKIREPKNRLVPIIPESKTLILVPGIAFDSSGNRLGRGGGFYDRYLKKYHSAVTMGIAYRCQLVEKIPVNEYDISLDFIL